LEPKPKDRLSLKPELKSLVQRPKVKSWLELMLTFKTVCDYLERELYKEGFSLSRFQTLYYLYFEGPLTGVDLSRRLLVTRGNISTFLRRLAKDGVIISKKESPKSKRKVYGLSADAARDFEEVFRKHIERLEGLMVVLDRDVLRDFKTIRERTAEIAHE